MNQLMTKVFVEQPLALPGSCVSWLCQHTRHICLILFQIIEQKNFSAVTLTWRLSIAQPLKQCVCNCHQNHQLQNTVSGVGLEGEYMEGYIHS